ncbi:metal ABC transporter ATP-binding protein [Nodularia spumigena CH309]|nr:metal ABC transporter ATP-binding protein [Nodularia spumigena CH309]
MAPDLGSTPAPTRPPVLAVAGLGVAYDGVSVLRDVTFGVGAGELVAVIGPNGAGKSTLFKAIIGAVAHTGHVDIDGTHCHHRRERTAIAYIPQRADLDLEFPLSVEELVLSGRRRFLHFGRRPTARDRDVARSCMASVGVDGLAGRRLGSLSGGQTQRVFLARALAQEAGVVLLDESLSGVDQPRAEELVDLFAALCRHRGTTLLVATHDLELTRRRFARCLAVNRRLVVDGAPAAVLDPAAIESVFASLGRPVHVDAA